eukprot:COSAG01_NODE_11713_length_1874_cov_1.922817_1_plen_152_part_00
MMSFHGTPSTSKRAAWPSLSPRARLKYWFVTRWITSDRGEVALIPSSPVQKSERVVFGQLGGRFCQLSGVSVPGQRLTPSGARGPVPAAAAPAPAPAIPSNSVTYLPPRHHHLTFHQPTEGPKSFQGAFSVTRGNRYRGIHVPQGWSVLPV